MECPGKLWIVECGTPECLGKYQKITDGVFSKEYTNDRGVKLCFVGSKVGAAGWKLEASDKSWRYVTGQRLDEPWRTQDSPLPLPKIQFEEPEMEDPMEVDKWWLDEEKLPGGLILGGPEGNFSEGQQNKFGINASGEVQNGKTFAAALERVCAVRKRVTIDKLKVMTIRNLKEDQWIPESEFVVHIKGFGNGLNGDTDGAILEDILSCNCGMMVWDGDLLEETGFTKMVPLFLKANSEAKALAFVLDYEVDDFRESWEHVIEQYPDRIRVVAVDMKPPTWRDAADHGITEELKDAQGLPEWAQEYFLVGRLACKATGSKQVFSLGGGGISAHEAKVSADSGVEWTVYALSRGRKEAYPTLADWAAANPSSSVKLRRNLDPNEDMAFCNVDKMQQTDIG